MHNAELMYPLTVIFVAAAAVAGFIRLALLWANNRLTIAMGSDLAVKAYRNTLYQPYVFHTSNNSSTLISAIISKVDNVIYRTFAPSLTLISSAILLLTLIATLLVIDAEVALTAAVVLGGMYLVITQLSRKTLIRNGQEAAQAIAKP